MVNFLIGLFMILHGMVHLWYMVLSQKLVEIKPEMGWTGKSWALTSALGDPTTRTLAGVLYTLAAVVFTVGGIGVLARAGWSRPVLAAGGMISSAVILLFWDGSLERIVERGFVGLLISLAMLASMLLWR